MGLKKCPECGFKIEETRKQCPNCGNRDFEKEAVYNKNFNNTTENTSNSLENSNYYKNNIANKLYNLANTLFGVAIVLAVIFIIIFFISLDDDFEGISSFLALFYGILFAIFAPVQKLIIISKAEQLELLYRINQNIEQGEQGDGLFVHKKVLK